MPDVPNSTLEAEQDFDYTQSFDYDYGLLDGDLQVIARAVATTEANTLAVGSGSATSTATATTTASTQAIGSGSTTATADAQTTASTTVTATTAVQSVAQATLWQRRIVFRQKFLATPFYTSQDSLGLPMGFETHNTAF